MKAIVLGAGRMGRAAAWDLCHRQNAERVTLLDGDEANLAAAGAFVGSDRLALRAGSVGPGDDLTALLSGHDVALSAMDYTLNVPLTRAAIAAGVHLCDLGGNEEVVRAQLALDADATAAGVTIVPDCGLAPGMAVLLGAHAARQLDVVEWLRIRVGGLPAHPKPPLQYKLVFSVRGLTNEYIEPAEVVRDGEVQTQPSLTETESIHFPEPYGELEAFNTHGGASTLPETLSGLVRNLDYKTLRYPGHCAFFRTMHDLGLLSEAPVEVAGIAVQPRQLTEAVLERALTDDDTDVVLVRVTAEGTRNSESARVGYQIIDVHDARRGHSAMMRTTAFPAAIVAGMLARGEVQRRGVVPGEECVPMVSFLEALAAREIVVEDC